MASPKIVTGDDVSIPVVLKKNGATFVISGDAVVFVRLVSNDHYQTYSESVSQSLGNVGNNLSASSLMVELPSATTEVLTYYGAAQLEIQVADPKKQTWFVPVEVVKGNIT